jgi:hypothetical protein
MIVIHFLISLFIGLFINIPATIIALPLLAVALLTKWDGTTFFFGNSKYTREKAATHYAAPTEGKYWKEFCWYGLRNPVYNLGAHYFAIIMKPDYKVTGRTDIGDKIRPGFYAIKMGWAWEYYWIYKYYVFGRWLCIRLRFGWKINGNNGMSAEQCFVPNPVMPYRGI